MARNSMTNIIEYDARAELIQKVVYEISNDLSSALDSNKYILLLYLEAQPPDQY